MDKNIQAAVKWRLFSADTVSTASSTVTVLVLRTQAELSTEVTVGDRRSARVDLEG